MDLFRPAVRAATRAAPRFQLTSLLRRPVRRRLRAHLASVVAAPAAAAPSGSSSATSADATSALTPGDPLAFSRLRNKSLADESDDPPPAAKTIYGTPFYRALLTTAPTYEGGCPAPSEIRAPRDTAWLTRFRAMRHECIREEFLERRGRYPGPIEIEAQDEQNWSTFKHTVGAIWFLATVVVPVAISRAHAHDDDDAEDAHDSPPPPTDPMFDYAPEAKDKAGYLRAALSWRPSSTAGS